jgi:superfamily II DNA/RNA helicase
MGVRAAALHADRTQQQRMAAVEGFRTGTYPVLVATDVAARGLDIEGIAHVVNFEVPDTPEAYVHRVGRTGRAESTGSALTLVAPKKCARCARWRKPLAFNFNNDPFKVHRAQSPRRWRPTSPARRERRRDPARHRDVRQPAVGRVRPLRLVPLAAAGRRREPGVLHASRSEAVRGHDRVRCGCVVSRSASTTSCAARRRSASRGTSTRTDVVSASGTDDGSGVHSP